MGNDRPYKTHWFKGSVSSSVFNTIYKRSHSQNLCSYPPPPFLDAPSQHFFEILKNDTLVEGDSSRGWLPTIYIVSSKDSYVLKIASIWPLLGNIKIHCFLKYTVSIFRKQCINVYYTLQVACCLELSTFPKMVQTLLVRWGGGGGGGLFLGINLAPVQTLNSCTSRPTPANAWLYKHQLITCQK